MLARENRKFALKLQKNELNLVLDIAVIKFTSGVKAFKFSRFKFKKSRAMMLNLTSGSFLVCSLKFYKFLMAYLQKIVHQQLHQPRF